MIIIIKYNLVDSSTSRSLEAIEVGRHLYYPLIPTETWYVTSIPDQGA